MYVACVTIFVEAGQEQAFIAATKENHEGTRQEPGNRRFDVLVALDDPRRFLLYEAYDSAEAFAAHQQTAHYLRWKEAVAPWMAQPRQGVKHRSLFPSDQAF